jgi:hypothetical protein
VGQRGTASSLLPVCSESELKPMSFAPVHPAPWAANEVAANSQSRRIQVMSNSITSSLTINDLLSAEQLTDEELLAAYGGSGGLVGWATTVGTFAGAGAGIGGAIGLAVCGPACAATGAAIGGGLGGSFGIGFATGQAIAGY